MDKNRNINSFEESLRNSLQGAKIAPSPELWDRIEASLDKPTSVSPWLMAAKWGGAVAASVALALAVNVLFTPEVLREPYTVMLSSGEFVELEDLPIALEPIRLSRPQFICAAQNSDSAAPIDVEYIEYVEPAEESKTEPTLQVTAEEKAQERASQKRASTPLSSVVLTNPSAMAIDSERIFGKKKTRRYATSAAAAALAATGVSLIDFNDSVSTLDASSSALNDEFVLFDPDTPTTDTPLTENDDLLMQNEKGYNPSKASHSLPIYYGLSVSHRLGKRWSVESGVNYTRLNSEITMLDSEQPLSQVVQFIGVPLRFSYEIYSINRFSLYASTGGQLERCISSTLDSNDIEEKDWHISADGALGLQYKVCKWLGVYAEPEVGYYFTPTTLNTIRTENPLNFNLNFGVRILLGE